MFFTFLKKWVFKTLVLSFWLSFYYKTHFIKVLFYFFKKIGSI
ncbi:putative membrane protein [Helicobacter pylori Hp H-29]|nr:putative membrane protein [Helicobacter pylori Hp H-29]